LTKKEAVMHGLSKRLEADFRRRGVRTSVVTVLVAGLLAPGVGCERAGEVGVPAVDRTRADAAPQDAGAGSAEVPPIVSAPTSSPPVVFDPPTLDFGIIPPNTDRTGTVAVRNEGDAPVRILSLKPTCKCTTLSDLAGAVIEPGEAVTLTTELQGQAMSGQRKAAVKFAFAGYDEVLTVEIRAEVALPVRVLPGILNMARETTSGHVVVESMDGRPFTILAADRKPPRYVGFDPEIDELRNSYLLEWDLAQELADKKLPHWWVIETDHPECAIADAWVRHLMTIEQGKRERRWRVADRRVLVGLVEPGQAAEFSVRVTDIGADRIYAVRSLSGEFQARLLGFERAGTDGRCKVQITPRADHRGVFQGAVEFMADRYTHAIDIVGKVAP
jgi:hypothetical protein